MKIGLQLYSVRDAAEKDMEGTLKKVSEFGYDGVELAGLYGHGPNELKEWLRRYSLELAGSHTSFCSLILWALGETLQQNEELENKNVVIPSFPGELSGKEGQAQLVEYLNDLSAVLARAGLRLGYHNHWWDFQGGLEGSLWSVLANGVPSMFLQLDLGHALRALGSSERVVSLIGSYPGRFLSVHAKDYSRNAGYAVLPGQGDLNWDAVIGALEETGGTEWLIVEQEENVVGNSLETSRAALESLKKLLGIS